MAVRAITAADLIGIGERLHILRWPAHQNVDVYQDTHTEFPSKLEAVGFSDALVAMQGHQVSQLRYNTVTGLLDDQQSQVLKAAADIVGRVLMDEAREMELIVCDSDLPACLLSLKTNPTLTAEQRVYLADTEACLRARQYRPAIVMAWTLCYDWIRQWVFRDQGRLADFNALLSTRTTKRAGGPIQIVDYEDFYRLGEADVLAGCRDAPNSLTAFSQRHHRDLQAHLDLRNDMAHANNKSASSAQAKAYVENVIATMTSRPFI